jgi:nicotinamidase/pyrazinamidase
VTIAIDRERDALLVVDVQPDFMPGGALPIDRGDDVVGPIAALLCRGLTRTVAATQDWHPPDHVSFASQHAGRAPYETMDLYGHEQVLWPRHCVQGTPGAALHGGLPLEPFSVVVRKGQDRLVDSYSGFRDNHGPGGERPPTGLAGFLRERGVRRVVICGLALDYCVAWTALDAVAMGFQAILLGDLARPVAQASGARAIEEMSRAGVVVAEAGDLLAG